MCDRRRLVIYGGAFDLFSRGLIGWAMHTTFETALPLATRDMGLHQREPATGLLHHSDRGVQYASGDYRACLAANHCIASMSRKANCYDNATTAAFWSTLKNEPVHRRHFFTRAQAANAIVDYMNLLYNRRRMHSSLGYQTPLDYETNLNSQKPNHALTRVRFNGGSTQSPPKDYLTIPKCFINTGWAFCSVRDGLDVNPPEARRRSVRR